MALNPDTENKKLDKCKQTSFEKRIKRMTVRGVVQIYTQYITARHRKAKQKKQ